DGYRIVLLRRRAQCFVLKLMCFSGAPILHVVCFEGGGNAALFISALSVDDLVFFSLAFDSQSSLPCVS
ncbi:MAG: hypothetical protein ACYDDI_15670, partial [Candidatus Acidiferrales bacterium]